MLIMDKSQSSTISNCITTVQYCFNPLSLRYTVSTGTQVYHKYLSVYSSHVLSQSVLRNSHSHTHTNGSKPFFCHNLQKPVPWTHSKNSRLILHENCMRRKFNLSTRWFIITGPHKLSTTWLSQYTVCVYKTFQARARDNAVWSAIRISKACTTVPLPCNICISVTSWDGLINVQITAAVGQSHPSACLCQSERRTLWTQSYPVL